MPGTTRPMPIWNVYEPPWSAEASNFVPFASVPTYSMVTIWHFSGVAPVPTTWSMYFKPEAVVVAPDAAPPVVAEGFAVDEAPLVAVPARAVDVGVLLSSSPPQAPAATANSAKAHATMRNTVRFIPRA